MVMRRKRERRSRRGQSRDGFGLIISLVLPVLEIVLA